MRGIAVIDWERVAELRAELGEAVFAEVVELFLEEVETVLARLRPGLPPAALETELHFVKGNALNIGFGWLADLCRDGERAVRAGRAAPVDLDTLRGAWRESRDAFLAGLQAADPGRLVG